ncbi:MAG: hypothetical protein MI724_02840, partial [Spirochaetales bacterium]|nr:hypothetical protein [Spirochaetales bacterium]
MNVHIDLDADRAPFSHFWCSTGLSPASLLLNADMRQQMAYAGSTPHRGVRYVRVHYLLDLVRAEGLDSDEPAYDWSALDRCLDTLIENDLLPFFELMGNPGGLFTDFTDKGQAVAWRRMVRDLAHHYTERYGASCVREWYFETWNEPDGAWWTQSEEAFCIYYDACSEGLKDADPTLRFGGPGTCRGLSSMLKVLLAHCDDGTNTVTGETGVRLDFISFHEKGAPSCPEDIDPDSVRIIRSERAIIDYIRTNHPRLAEVPVMNNECDPQVGWWDLHTWRGTAYHAAIAAKTIVQHHEAFIDTGVDYRLLSNDNGFVGTWGQRTLTARFGLHSDPRAQSEHTTKESDLAERTERRRCALVKKPVLTLMAQLALLGDERCRVSGLPSSLESDVGVLATRRGDDQVAVLVYYSRDRIRSSGEVTVQCTLAGIPFDRAALVEYRIEEGYTDPFSAWVAAGHAKEPSGDDLRAMRDAAELAAAAEPADVAISGGELTLDLTLPLPAVRLVVLSRRPDDGPLRLDAPGIERYDGLDEAREDVLVRWP